jgi:hypothetical protein
MIKKVIPFLILCLILVSANIPRKEKMKIVQAKIIYEHTTPQLNSKLNEWLIQQRIQREDVISTHFHCDGVAKRVLMLYEVEYTEKKEGE